MDANGSGLSSHTVALSVNGTAYTEQTNQSGYVTLHPALQPGDTSANMYQVLATFNGTNPRTASLNASDPYGDQYVVCTTNQYDLRSSTNSSTLAVLLQSTDAITAAKTIEQMQKEVESSGQLNTKPVPSWGYPWFWLETTVCNLALNFSLVTCTSVFGGWLGSCYGIENPLFQIFAGVTPQQVDVLTSAAIASITTTAATFIGGYIATSVTEWSLVGYLAGLLAYGAGGFAALYSVYSFFDAYAARAALITAGFALLALSTLGFTKTIPIFVPKIIGGDPVTAAVKCIVNSILGFAITTAILRVLGASVLKLPFYVITFVLGLTALYLGYTKICRGLRIAWKMRKYRQDMK